MSGATPLLPFTPSWHGAELKEKHRDNFISVPKYGAGILNRLWARRSGFDSRQMLGFFCSPLPGWL
jgi:hypothetical protein